MVSKIVDNMVLHNWCLQYVGRRIFLAKIWSVFTICSIPRAFPFYAPIGHFICGKTEPSVLLTKNGGKRIKKPKHHKI